MDAGGPLLWCEFALEPLRVSSNRSNSTEASISGAMIFVGRLGIPRQLGSLLVGSKLGESITSAAASSARNSVPKG
jgi:hypothetical protein